MKTAEGAIKSKLTPADAALSFLLFTLTLSGKEGNTDPHYSCPAYNHTKFSPLTSDEHNLLLLS